MTPLEKYVGQVLDDKYRLERLLGKGGMGAVYLATHLGTDRYVALKLIMPQFMRNEEFVERFKREARAAGRLRHPNVVDVTDFGFSGSGPGRVAYLVMEYLDGCTLSDVLHEENRLPLYWVVDILEQVCSAVHEAHQQGVVHRDLKPDNIWLEPNGLGGYRVKVLDFGIAKLGEAAPLDLEFIPPARIDEDVATQIPVRQAIPATVAAGVAESEARADQPPAPREVLEAATLINPALKDEEPPPDQGDQATRMFPKARSTVADMGLTSMPLSDAASDTGLTRVGAILGTPLYMSPEQCRGEHLDARSDIYSIGVIAYQMLTGSTPFSGETTTIITAHKEKTPQPAQELNKKLPKRVSRAVMSALEKDRTARPQTAAAFASAMRANADGLGTLYRRAFALYSEYFPQFLKLSFLAHIPSIVMTLTLAGLMLFQTRLPKIAFGISVGVIGLLQIPATLFAAWMISAVTSVLVSQLAVAPLKPVELKTGFDVLRGRLRPFVRTGLRVFFKILLGWILFVIPGFVMTIRYMLWAPVVLLEGLQGKAALKRARQLASRSWLTVIFICVVQLLTPSLVNLLMARLLGINRGVQVGHRVRVTGQLTSLTTVFIMPLMSIVPALVYLKMRQLGGETLTEIMAQLQVLDEAKSDWQQRMRSRLTVTPQSRTPTY
jgi:serine/threonine protein kinase